MIYMYKTCQLKTMEFDPIKEIYQNVLKVCSSTSSILKKVSNMAKKQCDDTCASLYNETKEHISHLREEISHFLQEKGKVKSLENELVESRKHSESLQKRLETIERHLNIEINNETENSTVNIKSQSTKHSSKTAATDTRKENANLGIPDEIPSSITLKELEEERKTRKQLREQSKSTKRNLQTKAMSERSVLRNTEHISTPNFEIKQEQTVVSNEEGASSTMIVKYDPVTAQQSLMSQRTKELYLTTEVWVVEGIAEQQNGSEMHNDLVGAKTVILLDISESMRNDHVWEEAKTFIDDYLTGLEDMALLSYVLQEHVALVTFGHQTRCQQRFTTDLSLIRSTIDRQCFGGPSPLYGGFTMTKGVLTSTSEPSLVLTNDIHVNAKVVLITDGYATETCLHRGPDVIDESKLNETVIHLINTAEHMKSNQFMDTDLFCVPVGKANMDLLQQVCEAGNGRILSFREGRQLSRRLMLAQTILPPNPVDLLVLVHGARGRIPRDDRDITGQDKTQMLEIIERDHQSKAARKEREINPFGELDDKNLPNIGTRVHRGPDWSHNDGDQNGTGTVVGHAKTWNGNSVWVNWDATADICRHSYGESGKYAVLPVDEPRMLLPGQPVEVGCIVTPGRDFSGNEALPGDRGVVMQVQKKGPVRKVVVRWDNVQRGLYSYGEDRKFEVRICEPMERDTLQSSSSGSIAPRRLALPRSTTEQKPRKKNKNS